MRCSRPIHSVGYTRRISWSRRLRVWRGLHALSSRDLTLSSRDLTLSSRDLTLSSGCRALRSGCRALSSGCRVLSGGHISR